MKKNVARFSLFIVLHVTGFCAWSAELLTPSSSLPDRFLSLLQAQGVAGHEDDVRAAVLSQLPDWAKPQIDQLGNLIITLGKGEPHLAIVAALDENGYIISGITPDGYLRLHRHTARNSHPLREQFFVGQPVQIRSASGKLIPGVTTTPSTHLSRLLPAYETSRVREMSDLWVDVGASDQATVSQLGLRMLDSVNLRNRATRLANDKVAGVDSQLRAGAQTLIEMVRGYVSAPQVNGTLTLAWVTQSQFGDHGLNRLATSVLPQRAYLIGGSAGGLQSPPKGWENTRIELKSVPSLFAETPVEVIDTRHITALASELQSAVGLPLPTISPSAVKQRLSTSLAINPVEPVGPFAILKTMIEAYGVSEHEGPVREAILKALPAWAKPVTDEQGNLSVSFGSGGKELLFVAHMDEVGFDISGLREDGSARVRVRGGVYLSLYEAQPVLVHTERGIVRAIMTPRPRYSAATRSQPEIETLSIYFGTASAAETRALGVNPGQSITVPKAFIELAAPRATGRSMDDRAGVTAQLMALATLDPAKVKNRVTFAFSVGEEIGLIGARALAKRVQPEVAFAIDTFVSTDTPTDPRYLAHAPLGAGAVLRGVDSMTVVPAQTMDRITKLARENKIALQIGVTQGGTDASEFSSRGAIDVGLSWPGRYSHSPVEVIDRRDLESLARLISVLAQQY